MNNIRIEWKGPYKLTDIGYDYDGENYMLKKAKLDDKIDFGVYQVYGFHPVYGNNVLLYIGKAKEQTFAKRLSQEGWEYNADYKNLQIYVGRLFSNEELTLSKWSEFVDIAESMLIYAHAPAMNSSNILNISKDKKKLKKFENVRIFNYDECRSLFPEVSGELWIKEVDFNGVFSKKEK